MPVVPSERFFSRPQPVFWTGLVLVALVGVVAVLIPARPLAVDLRWSEAMRDIESGPLLAFAVTESLTPLAVNLLKALVDRPRPPGGLLDATGSSFPSGHAAYAGA